MNRVLLLNIQTFSKQMTKTWCVGGRYHSESNNQYVYEKIHPKTIKIVKDIKDFCSFCGRNRSQNFTKFMNKQAKLTKREIFQNRKKRNM